MVSESSFWRERLGSTDVLLTPESDPFFMPSRVSVIDMRQAVKGAIADTRLQDVGWKRDLTNVLHLTAQQPLDIQTT